MKKTVLIFLIAILSAAAVSAESDFQKWQKKQKRAFKSFLSEQEKAFSDMLKKEWEEFQTQSGFIIDKAPKPEAQPTAGSKDSPDTESENPVSTDSQETPAAEKPYVETSNKITPKKPIPPVKLSDKKRSSGSLVVSKAAKIPEVVKKEGVKNINIDFYGSPLAVPVATELKTKKKTGKINNKSISEFFEYYSEQKMDITLTWLKSLKTDYLMNGWSVLKISEKISEKLYNSKKDRILMTWYLMLKADYDVKIAYSSINVYLLYSPEVKVYAAPYITEKNKQYYFYNKSSSKNERIRTYSGSLIKNPGLVKLSPENPENFKSEPLNRKTSFKYKRKNYPVNLEYNNSIIKYYKEYPQVDISYYFRKNISDSAVLSYKKSLYPYIRNMNEKDAVQFILSFVQNGFKYKTDGKQFGYEKPMFPDETLHYPYIDCEDRSALFISIVKELIGIDAVALDYPGHIAAAVNFKTKVNGDYITYKGKRYTVCDPTYINASIGMTMPDYKKVKPVIVEANQ